LRQKIVFLFIEDKNFKFFHVPSLQFLLSLKQFYK